MSQPNARRLADQLIDVVENRDFDGLAGLVPQVVGSRAPESHLFRPLLAELVVAVAELIRLRTGTSEVHETFTVGLFDEGNRALDIDELQPPLRAMLRAVLAELNGDAEDARIQLEFAASDPDVAGRVDALLHLARWVRELRPGRP
ncbi:hypothetical protein ORV05_03570 [Amycolatopsis cynarae]|uniref:Uncharacterized protein n=1 Tax=Amycolatopsis cynarae TaxID=2995223 RepID=A0ABY7B643_9PSEU|nr:hypothetical protein [Amycolatopsis sp. HUAS 11-8]WAL66894.1 hypothetical protein ORV05_03570 [Amycolatopsis sp. HUAS 11-8]